MSDTSNFILSGTWYLLDVFQNLCPEFWDNASFDWKISQHAFVSAFSINFGLRWARNSSGDWISRPLGQVVTLPCILMAEAVINDFILMIADQIWPA